jgi:hypothetical protein
MNPLTSITRIMPMCVHAPWPLEVGKLMRGYVS